MNILYFARNFSKGFSRGFTLIELLVVIAIIGILASIVMGQLAATRAKAANVAIKANLANLRTQAALINSTTSSYSNICTDTIVVQALTQAGILGGEPAKCFDSQDAWVAVSTLNVAEDTATHWCADSATKSQGITEAEYNAITSASTLCP